MLEKIKKHKYFLLIKQLQDIRAVGLLVFGVIVILITWSGVGAVETNYKLQQQISQLQQGNNLSALQNNNLQLQNQYYNTNEYLELQGRQLFGKGLPGEKEFLVPQSLALSQIVPMPIQTSTSATSPSKPTYQKNFEAWIDFYFHINH